MTSKPELLSQTTKCEGILWNQEETEHVIKGKGRIPKLVFNTYQALPPTRTVDAIKTVLAVSQPKSMPNTKGLHYYFEKPFEREHMSIERVNQLFVVEEARDTDLEEKLIHSDLGYQLERDNPSILVNASTESKEELLHPGSDCQLEVTSSWRVDQGSPQIDASPYKYPIKKREKIEQSTMMLYVSVVQNSCNPNDSLVVLVGKLPKQRARILIVEIVDRMNGYTHYIALTHPYTAVEAAQYYLAIHGVDLQRTFSYHSQLNGLNEVLSDVETVREWPVPTKEKELVRVVHDDLLQTTKVAGCYGQLPVHILNAGPVKWECSKMRMEFIDRGSSQVLREMSKVTVPQVSLPIVQGLLEVLTDSSKIGAVKGWQNPTNEKELLTLAMVLAGRWCTHFMKLNHPYTAVEVAQCYLAIHEREGRGREEIAIWIAGPPAIGTPYYPTWCDVLGHLDRRRIANWSAAPHRFGSPYRWRSVRRRLAIRYDSYQFGNRG
ncbi:unnamed protein product [Cuscuta campestris]|uniref:Uncharacterized protein n=1 Tax=Cuscuta campestris TaxID=132261 RepID=A0A484N1S4_9ASTE|nr:unnamed protein product [Cuscuta campestris]